VNYRPPRSPGRGAGRYEERPRREPYEPYAAAYTRVQDAHWEPRTQPRRIPPRQQRRPSGAMTGGKIAVAALSALVLFATAFYSNKLNNLDDGLTRQDVINGTPSERPADGAIDILMVGMDSRTNADGTPLSKELLRELTAGKFDGTLNTDTLILIRIPNDGGRAVGVSMPRDSYVNIPGYGQHKINSAYARAKNTAMEKLSKTERDQAKREVASNLEGAKSLIATIEQLTGATIDHYAEVNLLGFYDITKAIGGIEVCLNKAVNDDLSGAHLPAGKQTLSGAPALAFVRQRHGLPNGDLDRIVRQQVFMSGMAKKVLSGNMLLPGSSTLDDLAAAVKKSVVLDKDWNVLEFAQQMTKFTGGNLDFRTIPVGSIALKTPGDGDAVEVNPREVKAFVSGLLGGGGQQPSSGSAPPSAPPEQPVTVDVRNASGKTGLANQVQQSLVVMGFKAGETGNATLRPTSVVRYASGEQTNGQRVADALGGLQAETDRNLPKGRVTVLLGKDFKLSSGNQLTGARLLTMDQMNKRQPTADGCVN
jgi:LCP family protein required for cell wall assembly